jgi:hypothetical protein
MLGVLTIRTPTDTELAAMNRTSPLPTFLATTGALAGLAALGAALIVSPGAASPLPTTVQATKAAPATPAKADAVSSQAEASKPEASKPDVAPVVANATPEPKRTVRVVYVGPITGK